MRTGSDATLNLFGVLDVQGLPHQGSYSRYGSESWLSQYKPNSFKEVIFLYVFNSTYLVNRTRFGPVLVVTVRISDCSNSNYTGLNLRKSTSIQYFMSLTVIHNESIPLL